VVRSITIAIVRTELIALRLDKLDTLLAGESPVGAQNSWSANMTTKRVEIYVEGWICSACENENLEHINGDNCGKCGKAYEDEKDHCFDNEKVVEFPAKWAICYDCQGEGTTYLGWAAKDQPAFTQEDFDYEGPDFYEDYMGGRYDAQCPACHGEGKVKEIDEKAVAKNPELKAHLNEHHEALRASAEIDAEMAAERRMGA